MIVPKDAWVTEACDAPEPCPENTEFNEEGVAVFKVKDQVLLTLIGALAMLSCYLLYFAVHK